MILELKTFQDIAQYPTPSDIDCIVTHGYHFPGDGGGGFYKREVTPPAHGAYGTSATGAYFELKPGSYVTPEQFGASGDGSSDDTAAFLAFRTWAITISGVVELRLYPGKTYMVGNPFWPTDIEKLRVYGCGAVIKNNATIDRLKYELVPAYGLSKKNADWTPGSPVDSYHIQTSAPGEGFVTTVVAADAINFVDGETVLIGALARQYGGFPPSYLYFEYTKVVGNGNGTTGVVTLEHRLRHEYRSDLPYIGDAFTPNDGRARIWKIDQGSNWGINHEYSDINFVRNDVPAVNATEAVFLTGDNVTYNRCGSNYFLPAMLEHGRLNHVTQTGVSEFDKLINVLEIDGGVFNDQVMSGTGINALRVSSTKFLKGYDLNPKIFELVDCDVLGGFGDISIFNAFGHTEQLIISGGYSEEIPRASSIVTTQTVIILVDGQGAVWSAPFLTLNLTSLNPLLGQQCWKFQVKAYPGQVIREVVEIGGSSFATGVFGIVESVTGGDNIATIKINFNGELTTNKLMVAGEPASVSIKKVFIGNELVTQNFLNVTHDGYRQKPLLLQSGATWEIYSAGMLKRLYVEVLRPYTGSTGGNITLRVHNTAPGVAGARLDRFIDLKTTGTREATPSSNSGWSGVSGESAAANLLNADLVNACIAHSAFNVSTMSSTSDAQLPIVAVEMEFDNEFYF